MVKEKARENRGPFCARIYVSVTMVGAGSGMTAVFISSAGMGECSGAGQQDGNKSNSRFHKIIPS